VTRTFNCAKLPQLACSWTPEAALYSRLGKGMGGRSAAYVSAFLIRRLLSAFFVVLPLADVLAGQSARTPEDLLKKAQSLHQDGKLDQAIEDYLLFL
jgi:hypothetical protein